MRVSDTEWQWDRSKLTLYFTAETRVDFRGLVRDLAGMFKTRIELRQIGVRDEAARLTGVGRCGREYCCSTWLKELTPVSLALAKDQNLSLNPSQISGGCGRLLCCLKYEHEFYAAQRRRFPKEGKTIRTGRGAEKVIAVDIFRERVFLRGEGALGFYEQRIRCTYDGPPLEFFVPPALLIEIATKHRDVVLTDTQLKVNGGKWVYVACLVVGEGAVQPTAQENGEDGE